MKRHYLTFLSLLTICIDSAAQQLSYHPNSYWTVPVKQSIKPTKDAFNYFEPQFGFPIRFKEGTWHNDEWQVWRKANGFSFTYRLAGHSWQSMIANNKDVFKQHPEFLAEVKGARLGYGKTNKLCVSNKDLQALFINSTLSAFTALKNPNGSVSVEPSDGSGFCECPKCKAMGSISNQVFHLANLAAKAIRKKYPNGKVNLYAYYLHAAVPDFPLEPNVHVTVIPEGFQDVYDPEVMLALWAQKAKLKTYYEYFVIPQHKGELPRVYIQNYLRRLRLAQKLGYKGFWFEAGLNLNSTIAIQLFNQLWLNPNLSWENVSETFLRTCFKDSYLPMKRLFTRWWHTWIPEEEISMALYDLQEASHLVKKPDERERIDDLKAYLHYIVLYQDWIAKKKDSISTIALFDYIYNSSNRMIINTSAMYQMFSQYIPKKEVGRFNLSSKKGWAWIHPLTTTTTDQNFKADIKRFGVRKSNFLYIDMQKGVKIILEKYIPLQQFEYISQFTEKIFFHGEGKFKIELIKPVDVGTNNNNKLSISILSEDGELVKQTFIKYDNPTIEVSLPQKGIYTLSFLDFFHTRTKLTGKFIPILTEEQISHMQQFKPKQFENVRIVNTHTSNKKKSSYYYIVE